MLFGKISTKLSMNTTTILKSLSGVGVVFASTVSAIAMVATLPASAATLTFTGNGSGGNIPDSSTTGFSSTITVPTSSNFLITDVTVTLTGLQHNFLGQVRAALTYVPTNTTVSLFNRVGRIVPPATATGDNSDFNGNYSFNDAFTGNIWTVAASVGNFFDVASGNYFATGGNSSTKVPMLASLGGQESSGVWRLTIADTVAGTTGSFTSWTLNLQGTPIPEPSSSLGLLALGLLGARAALERHLNGKD
ncbi:MAG: PEP-CTERM sorting domain-containing protein [Microcystis aeruginosa K13-05]|jgi:subtilisin-like proprotein convertase family protein|uniref:proprotein convertase P-domain-containing protein n=2 Tax=unclassified Microcystis TaxID=2643300 RepID=UPI00258CB14C|nr:proprotein convertase P-domain-containing protein [Microcystis sp. LE19-59.1C]NCR82430.1 PEP-CTERM sorting domain-containing protein [Microcystis aeruginosa K13-10]NCR86989.1 PEP-CTERM sorting domain-containing protein [Microcystis aeruginosa K13-05]